MSLRGKVAVAGIGEVPTRRETPQWGNWGICAEAARLAIEDSGLRKQDIDGLITAGGDVYPSMMADVLGIQPVYAAGVSMMGASSGTAVTTAAMAIATGVANNVSIVMGGSRQPGQPFGAHPQPGVGTEWEQPYGPAVAANTGYGIMYRRHMYEYGTTEEQLAHMAVKQRFNALLNPNAAFHGQPITHYKGTHPINTDGGQLSGGQPAGASGGFRHFIEAVRQLMGRAGQRQVVKHDLAMTNH